MNYLAHAFPLIEHGADPYEVAGVATPDWLGVAARRVKCRSKHAEPFLTHPDPAWAAVARGIVRHHADDLWFHESRSFTELSLGFAKQLRETLAEATSMRPWFVGHILVEMLLDAELDRRQPGLLDAYYDCVANVDPERVTDAVERMCRHALPKLSTLIERFVEVRFIADYRTERGLMLRLNQVMGRVGLSPLPDSATMLMAEFREEVARRADDLLAAPAAAA